jgi:O-antigen biosynthesis protein
MSDPPPNGAVDVSEVPERFDPRTMHGEVIESEHLARYRWASQFAAGRRVLDAGCGVGYGAALLAQVEGSEVLGIDLAEEIIEAAHGDMPSGVSLEVGDVTELPYEEGRFDLVVCFEVIEHLENPDLALDEFRRVLAPAGLLVISSPNRDVYPPGNPHHLHEYVPAELYEALASRFPAVRMRRQHTWITSGVLDDERFEIGDDTELSDVELRKLSRNETGGEIYTLALAGLGDLPADRGLVVLNAPLELRKWDELWHEQDEVLREQGSAIREQTADLAQRVHEVWALREHLATAETELARIPDLEAQTQELVRLNDELIQLNDELLRRADYVEELEATARRYTVVVKSSSWRLTRPLRQVATLLRGSTRDDRGS